MSSSKERRSISGTVCGVSCGRRGWWSTGEERKGGCKVGWKSRWEIRVDYNGERRIRWNRIGRVEVSR